MRRVFSFFSTGARPAHCTRDRRDGQVLPSACLPPWSMVMTTVQKPYSQMSIKELARQLSPEALNCLGRDRHGQ